MNLNFFKNLEPLQSIGDLQNSSRCSAVPENWMLWITDVKGSTEAIRCGRYREVNIAGALCILAIINSPYYPQIPFIFGGDGVMFLIPNRLQKVFEPLMIEVSHFVSQALQLELRIGMVAVKDIYAAEKELAIAKLPFGHGGWSAIFEGNGIDFAEHLVKMPDSIHLLTATIENQHEIQFNGFFCPFADIPSQQGHVMALIIKPLQLNWSVIANQLLSYIGNEQSHHPLDVDLIGINQSSTNVHINAMAITGKNSGMIYRLQKMKSKLKLAFLNRQVKNKKIQQTIRHSVIPASDYQKYDGYYKIVFRCDSQTLQTVIQWLNEQENAGHFKFGYHLTDRSIITCLFGGSGDQRQLHLIDAADGGYALAAAMLKQKR
ncbi:MAG: hypothetical protein RL637_22 [Pseudomonadota bacterium]